MVLLKALHLLGRSRLQVSRALCSHPDTAMEPLLGHLPLGRYEKFDILFLYSKSCRHGGPPGAPPEG